MIARQAQPRGYVLVLTLAVLMLASSLLVGIARVSLEHATEARRVQNELQRRWAMASVRTAILPFAEKILTHQETLSRRRGST